MRRICHGIDTNQSIRTPLMHSFADALDIMDCAEDVARMCESHESRLLG